MNLGSISSLKTSFTITFVGLIVSAILNLIESIRTTLPHVRHILSLEACIAIIAAYFYSIFMNRIEAFGPINWPEITKYRYLDWAFTTPLMLLGLCLFLAHHSKTTVSIIAYLGIVLLDYFMLYFGYLGETKQLDRTSADVIGFLGYIGLFAILFKYVKNSKINYMIFTVYAIIWAMYGVVYFLDDYNKNLITNWLDLISKALVGIGLWVYFSKIMK
jgi:bacteriorhodopsin